MKKNIKIGQYFFCHKRNMWSVYQYTSVTETSSSARHIEDCWDYEKAVRTVYSLNGWKQPETVTKRF